MFEKTPKKVFSMDFDNFDDSLRRDKYLVDDEFDEDFDDNRNYDGFLNLVTVRFYVLDELVIYLLLVGLHIFIFSNFLENMSKDNLDFFDEKKEWSVIKDKLLACYLEPYFVKVLKTSKPIFYVDCFAGKGKFDDDLNGSPLIAMDLCEKCLNVEERGSINLCFIEKKYASELNHNIRSRTYLYDEPEIISGKYEDKILSCLENKIGQNIFLYLDPYGYSSLNFELFEKFSLYDFNSIEMLINFNSFGFFRNACYAMKVQIRDIDDAFIDVDDDEDSYDSGVAPDNQKLVERLNRVAGGDYWKEIVENYNDGKISGYQAEIIFSNKYKEHLKQIYKYVLDIPIRLKQGFRPKYRMIHVTNHKEGCLIMARNMLNRYKELITSIQLGGQRTIYDDMNEYSYSFEGYIIPSNEIEAKVRDLLPISGDEVGLDDFFLSFINENGIICDFNVLTDILKKMEAAGEIVVRREPTYTKKGKRSTFWTEEKNKKLFIKVV